MQEKADGKIKRQSPHPKMDDNPTKFRSLVRLPNVEEATALVEGRIFKRKKLPGGLNAISYYASAPPPQRSVTVKLQAVLKNGNDKDQDTVQIFDKTKNEGGEEAHEEEKEEVPVKIPDFVEEAAGFHVMKTFPIMDKSVLFDEEESDLLRELKTKQAQVAELEKGMEPHLRNLLSRVVQERLEYEKGDYWAKKQEEERIMEANRRMIDRRRVEDLEKQKKLEQDMDAVCCICNDGEVTPDNQIIFCESCDVPVHQHCYGVEKIPSEDYYCLACQYFGYDTAAKESNISREKPTTLPVICSLCPHKGGALIRAQGADYRQGRGLFPVPA